MATAAHASKATPSKKPNKEISDELCNWNDSYVKDHIVMQYPKMKKGDEINIAGQFLTYVFTGELKGTNKLGRLVYSTASFLRHPEWAHRRGLFVNLISDIETFKYETNFRLENDNFLSSLIRDDMKKGGFSLFCFRQSVLTGDYTALIAYASFLANVMLRTAIKRHDPDVAKKALTKFNEFFPGHRISGMPPIVPIKVLDSLSKVISTTSVSFTNHFCQILLIYKNRHQGSEELVRYLNFIILMHSNYFGLRVMRDYHTLTKKYEADFSKLESSLVGAIKASYEAFKKFDETYEESGQVLWPWARVVNNDYLKKYSVDNHQAFTLLLMALLEPYEGPGIWNSKFLEKFSEKDVTEAKLVAEVLKKLDI